MPLELERERCGAKAEKVLVGEPARFEKSDGAWCGGGGRGTGRDGAASACEEGVT